MACLVNVILAASTKYLRSKFHIMGTVHKTFRKANEVQRYKKNLVHAVRASKVCEMELFGTIRQN